MAYRLLEQCHPLVTFTAVTQRQYFPAEAFSRELPAGAALAHAERNKTNCFWVVCRIKAENS